MARKSATVIPTKPATKQATVIRLLRREDGATLAELVKATDWLPHTARAALTGLRKKGHIISKDKRGTETCYRIVAGPEEHGLQSPTR